MTLQTDYKNPDGSLNFTQISLALTFEEQVLIGKIVQRAADMVKERGMLPHDKQKLMQATMEHTMAISCVHVRCGGLKLLQMLMSDNSDFMHDYTAIIFNINFREGVLMNDVKLRFSAEDVDKKILL